jgi:hypothetical protein
MKGEVAGLRLFLNYPQMIIDTCKGTIDANREDDADRDADADSAGQSDD